MITETERGNGAILVNRDGKRFVNEITTRNKASTATLSQKGESAYLVFDDSVRESLKQIEGYVHLGIVDEAYTIEVPAKKLAIPANYL